VIRDDLATGRRGRCFADTDLMISRCVPFGSIGVLARSSAAFIRARTSGRSRVAALSSLMLRTSLPPPLSRPFGSGRTAPFRKHRATPFAWAASENLGRRDLHDLPILLAPRAPLPGEVRGLGWRFLNPPAKVWRLG